MSIDLEQFDALQRQSWDAGNKVTQAVFVNQNLKDVPMQISQKYKEVLDMVMDTIPPSAQKNAVLEAIKFAKNETITEWFKIPKPPKEAK